MVQTVKEGVSHIVIFLPLILVAILLARQSIVKEPAAALPAPTPTVEVSEGPLDLLNLNSLLSKNTATLGARIHMAGPLVCKLRENEASISAYVKGGKIAGTALINKKPYNFYIEDDCLYAWENKAKEGMQMCGVESYLGLLGNVKEFSQNPAIKNMQLPLIGENGAINTLSQVDALIESCKEGAIPKNVPFTLPKGVEFKAQTP